jgi:membrane fusion protein (multidrug efflux system)
MTSFLLRVSPVLLLGVLQGCDNSQKQAKPALMPEVNVVLAGKMDVPVFAEYVGQTYGENDVEVFSRVDGWVTGVHFKEGSEVRKGQLLYTMDDLPIKTKIDAAAGRVAQARTQLVKAEADMSRVKPLADMNALSKRELDAAVAMLNAAKAEVSIAEAQLSNTRIELSYTRITAPIGGVIGLSKVQVGDYVGKLGASVNTISALGEVRVRFSVSEKEFLHYTRNQKLADSMMGPGANKVPVTLLLSDGTAHYERGYIDLANREIDPATGSILLQARFQNNEKVLRPGQYVKVRIQTQKIPDAIMVPQQAVNQLQNLYQVFVLNDSNKIVPRIIQTGKRVGSNWIIANGLQQGEKVAVIGNAIIKPNLVVKPVMMQWNYDSTSLQ